MTAVEMAKVRKLNPVPCGDITHVRCRRVLASLLKIAGSDMYVGVWCGWCCVEE
jgi:hypothetical protein